MRCGIEKESLRVRPDGRLAATPHPAALGSALTHPHITTDFSESQLELITGRCTRASRPASAELTQIHQVVYRRHRRRAAVGLEHALRPARRRRHPDRPVRHAPTSAAPRPCTAWASSNRYGRRMQAISGIHYNWSLPGLGNADYFALIRNFRRHGWLLFYLFGASPAVCPSFVAGPRARPAGTAPRHALPAARHHAAHGAPRLPERGAGFHRRELQRPGVLRRGAGRRDDAHLARLREDRHAGQGRQLPAALHRAAADRERVLRQDPPQVHHPLAASGRCTRCASAASSTSKCA